MATLHTVEPDSTHYGIIVKENQNGLFVPLINVDGFSQKDLDGIPKEKCIFLNTTNPPKIEGIWLGRVRHLMAIEGFFYKISSKRFELRASSKKDHGKIIYSSYKKYKTQKGQAHHIIIPCIENDYALIRVSQFFALQLSNESGGAKFLSHNNLK